LTPSRWVGWLATRKRVLLFAVDIWSQVAISIRLLAVDLAEALARMREGNHRKGNGCSVLGLCVRLQSRTCRGDSWNNDSEVFVGSEQVSVGWTRQRGRSRGSAGTRGIHSRHMPN
ncbi:uncharacterized protein CCOS01_16183, partial [Colletotrichum costaricense]